MPGLSTELHPISALSPRIAENLRSPVSIVSFSQWILTFPDIRKDHTCADVSVKTQNRVSDIVEMGSLDFVEKETVFDFGRVSDDGVVADYCIAADEGALPDLDIVSYYRRTFDKSGFRDFGTFSDPYIFFYHSVVAAKGGAFFQNVVFDERQDFVRIFETVENIGEISLCKVQKFVDSDFFHDSPIRKILSSGDIEKA